MRTPRTRDWTGLDEREMRSRPGELGQHLTLDSAAHRLGGSPQVPVALGLRLLVGDTRGCGHLLGAPLTCSGCHDFQSQEAGEQAGRASVIVGDERQIYFPLARLVTRLAKPLSAQPACSSGPRGGPGRTASLQLRAPPGPEAEIARWEPALQEAGRKITHSGVRFADSHCRSPCFANRNPRDGGSGSGGDRKEGKNKAAAGGGAAAPLPATWSPGRRHRSFCELGRSLDRV